MEDVGREFEGEVVLCFSLFFFYFFLIFWRGVAWASRDFFFFFQICWVRIELSGNVAQGNAEPGLVLEEFGVRPVELSR